MFDSLSHLLWASRGMETEVAGSARSSYCWRQLLGGVSSCAAALSERPGQRFAFHDEDSFIAACALFGAWVAGKTVVLPGDVLPSTRALLETRVDGWIQRCDIDLNAAAVALPAIAPDHLAIEVFTSGSTGAPVAISKTLRQLEAEVEQLDALWGHWLAGRRVLASVPHQHFYGLLFRILWPLAVGSPFDVERYAFPEALAARLAEEPAVLVSSPAFLKRWPEVLAIHPSPSPAVIFSSGGPLAMERSLALQDLLRCPVFEIYGSSETGGIAWRRPSGADTAWQAMPVVELDFSGEALSLRSPYMPDASLWYPTADRVEACAGGFRLLGRADRIVKVEEKRVSLDAVEKLLRDRPEVAEVRVCLLGEGRLGAVLVLNEAGRARLLERGRIALHKTLREALAVSLEAVALPRRWRHVEALPVNSMGKTTLACLLALFEDRPLQPERLAAGGSGNTRTFDYLVGAELAAFDGHFPAMSLLPGVVQLEWVARLAQQSFALPGGFSAIEALKFLQPIRPASRITIVLEYQPARARVAFRIGQGDTPLASGRLVFAGAEP